MTQFSSLYGSRLDQELGNDDSTILFTTARRKNAVNRGIDEFANITQCLERRVLITVVGGTAEYNLNSTTVIPAGDFNQFHKDGIEFRYTNASSQLTIVARDDLPRRDIDWLNQNRPGWRQSTVASSIMQLPEFTYVRQDGAAYYLGFTPTPSTGSSASAAVMLSYIADTPVMVNDTDEPYTFSTGARTDLRMYHQAGVHYAAHQLEKLRRDDQASDRQLQKFLGYVTRFMQDQRIPGGRQIRQARHYFKSRGGAGWGNALAWPWRS